MPAIDLAPPRPSGVTTYFNTNRPLNQNSTPSLLYLVELCCSFQTMWTTTQLKRELMDYWKLLTEGPLHASEEAAAAHLRNDSKSRLVRCQALGFLRSYFFCERHTVDSSETSDVHTS